MNRKSLLENLKADEYDLLVVGGGITGAGIALDAAARGLSVALVEMQDFASGTSSRSTKLIHGGLRYLKQFDFKLVNEVGRERAILHKLALHLVHPDKMLLPLIEDGNYGYWLTTVGLTVYDFLAGIEGDDRRKMLSKEEAQEKEPLLRRDILQGAGLYAEYRTDDARLVMAVIRTAWKNGAIPVNYVKASSFLYRDGQVCGAELIDMLNGQKVELRAKAVVNATGPWVDQMRSLDASLNGKGLYLTKGVHLVIDRRKLNLKQTVYFDNADKRMIFAVPRGQTVYLGTTDTVYSGEKASPHVRIEDVHYILDAVNAMFPGNNIVPDDIESSWAGLRPLIHEAGKPPSEISRKDEIFISDSGLISIAGGKLTGYRKMSERVVDKVIARHGFRAEQCTTDKIRLDGAAFNEYSEVEAFKAELSQKGAALFQGRTDADYLVNNYGIHARSIIEAALAMNDDIPHKLERAEMEFAIENEMVVYPLDFLERRSGRVNFDIASVMPLAVELIELLISRGQLSASARQGVIEEVEQCIDQASGKHTWKSSKMANQ